MRRESTQIGNGPFEGSSTPAVATGRDSANASRTARILTPLEVSGILGCAAADDARLGRSFGAPLIVLVFGGFWWLSLSHRWSNKKPRMSGVFMMTC